MRNFGFVFIASSLLLFIPFLTGCSTHSYISPADSDKPCIKNFRAEGSFMAGKTFWTEAPIASKSLSKIIDQMIEKLPGSGFKVDNVDKKRGIVHALHINTSKLGADRAAKLTAFITVAAPNPKIILEFKINPGQFSAEGDVQHELCDVISTTEIDSLDY